MWEPMLNQHNSRRGLARRGGGRARPAVFAKAPTPIGPRHLAAFLAVHRKAARGKAYLTAACSTASEKHYLCIVSESIYFWTFLVPASISVRGSQTHDARNVYLCQVAWQATMPISRWRPGRRRGRATSAGLTCAKPVKSMRSLAMPSGLIHPQHL